MSTATQTGQCKCGATVTRPAFDNIGIFGETVARMPFVCGRCVAKDEAEDDARERSAQMDRQSAMEARRRRAADIPPELILRAALDEDTPAATAAQEWVRGAQGGLVLTGPTGSGKSTLAATAAARMLKTGRVHWVSAPILLARLGSGLGTTQRDWALDLLTSGKPLVVDDIDKARPTAYGAEHVFIAVDERVARGVQLLVTTNLTLGELADRWPEPFGEAIASRLFGYCKAVRVGDRDRRGIRPRLNATGGGV